MKTTRALLLILIAIFVAGALVACGGETETEDSVEEAADVAEATAEQAADEIEAAADEVEDAVQAGAADHESVRLLWGCLGARHDAR